MLTAFTTTNKFITILLVTTLTFWETFAATAITGSNETAAPEPSCGRLDDSCSATPVLSKDGTLHQDYDTRLQQDVIDWVTSSTVGFFDGDKQEFRPKLTGNGGDSIFGIFAKEDIAAGTLLAKIPTDCVLSDWIKQYDDQEWKNFERTFYCGTTKKLITEAQLGDESQYAPYLRYLRQQSTKRIPYYWSSQGKALLEHVLGVWSTYKEYPTPPISVFKLPRDYKKRCNATDLQLDSEEGQLEMHMAIQVMQRSFFEHMIPLYDMYGHSTGERENLEMNINLSDSGVVKLIEVYALRDIQTGEQLCHSYSNDPFYGTPEFFRDYGFVEGYPQRWTFRNDDFEVGFDLIKDNSISEGDDLGHDELRVEWLPWTRWRKHNHNMQRFFRRHVQRFEQSVEPMLRKLDYKMAATDDPEMDHDLPNAYELAMVHQYATTMKAAFEAFIYAYNDFELSPMGGAPPYRSLTLIPHLSRNALAHDNFPTYLEQFYAREGRDEGWELVNEEKSGYQTIKFTSRGSNVCFVLDGEPQTCSYFSAHYHDIAAHFPTRYLEAVKRVAIIGGGDSKILQDMMQYNSTLEKVIHLELDQKVTRKCFKYFATEPYFEDDRIEWYFGDAAKSLRMVPSEYFGTFDLVFVDLSESGPLSFAVTNDLTVWDSIAQLVAPDGVLVKNELYAEALNEMFDNTLLLYYEQVPIINSWALTFATNRKDLLNPDKETMGKWDGIKTHLSTFRAAASTLDDHFSLAHDYQVNDARVQGRCVTKPSASNDKTDLAGILMVIDSEEIDAEKVTLNSWSSLESTLSRVLEEQGLALLSSLSKITESGQLLGAIIMKEGVVIARTWPSKRYCALDLQFWGSFDKLNKLKKGLKTALGSQTTSSFRMITTGVRGTSTEVEDRNIVGPPGINFRDCSETKQTEKIEKSNNEFSLQEMIATVVKESLDMIQGANGTIVVLCGSKGQSCLSFDAISDSVQKARESQGQRLQPLAFWTCPGTQEVDSWNSFAVDEMLECNDEMQEELTAAVAKSGQIVAFVVDTSASMGMAMIADRLWRKKSNQRDLLAEKFTFLIPVENPFDQQWKHNFLEIRRMDMPDYGHMFRAELVLEDGGSINWEIGVLSGQDRIFFGRLINLTKSLQEKTKMSTYIRKIEGGIEEIDLDQDKMEWLTESAFDRPGEEHFRTQRPFGEQHVYQFACLRIMTPEAINKLLEAAFQGAFEVQMKTESIGEGLVVAGVCSQGTVLLIWNGKDRIDLSIFSYSRHFLSAVADAFLARRFLVTLSLDEFPRGVGRVINLQRDLDTATGNL